MQKILLATKNPGKILEYKEIFKNLNLDCGIVTLKDLDITGELVEDGKTFEENAIKKAEFYSQFSALPILAEDSGLEINCLNGEPGVLSRRWPGHEASDEELIQMTLEKLKGVSWKKRGAQLRVVIAVSLARVVGSKRHNNFSQREKFCSALGAAVPAPVLKHKTGAGHHAGGTSERLFSPATRAGEIYTFEGILRGYITEKPIDSRIPGYPFRTIFYVPEIAKVLGELTMEEEARIAHRKKALKKALPILRRLS